MQYLVSFSGGITSWGAARRLIDQQGRDNVTLLFADTLIEDPDLYRFIGDAVANLGVPFVRIAEGRDPWQVFTDKRYLGNTRIDPCSLVLKRQLLDSWRQEHFPGEDVTIVVGITWEEIHRLDAIKLRLAPDAILAPLCDSPYMNKTEVLNWARAEGLTPPRLYEMGFAHNNCGGFCIKQGQAGFANLLRHFPERYAYHEKQEESLRQMLDKDVAIMRDRRGGTTTPLTMKALRERIESDEQIDMFDIGGCGCALD